MSDARSALAVFVRSSPDVKTSGW